MRAGRKRKLGDRKPCGRLQQDESPDRGTPEFQARRREAFGNVHSKHGRELICPVDRLEKQLTKAQYRAGRKVRSIFARYCIAIGAPRCVSGMLDEFIQGGSVEPVTPLNAMDAVIDYRYMVAEIRNETRAAYKGLVKYPDAVALRVLRDVERIMRGSMPKDIFILKVGLNVVSRLYDLEIVGEEVEDELEAA
jgi:hypothetical protein